MVLTHSMAFRCDRCRHWDGQEWIDYPLERAGFGRCKRIEQQWDVLDRVTPHQNDETWKEQQKEALKEARAVVMDGSSYHAELLTAPNFGCALFLEKST